MGNTQHSIEPGPDKLGRGADLLLTGWIIIVAISYFGPLVNPRLGRLAVELAPVYAVMVILAILSLALRLSRHLQNERTAATTPGGAETQL